MKNININNKILIINTNKLEKIYKVNMFILIKKISKRLYLIDNYLKKKFFNKKNFFYNINYINLKFKSKKKYFEYYYMYNNISYIVLKEFINKKIYINIYD
ncbi:MAG: hypothetical protein ABNO60_00405 [Candidatus Shikimatogenerans sp. Tcar]|uniref:Uncharacterized protein n=1 Tax=Candidatus Shikimatogenerans sp. Tcar TaxID=3158565 RepID=A0AAU7QV32_9FLAO